MSRGKKSKIKKYGGRRRGGPPQKTSQRLLEQPVASPIGAVPCEICGHPVEPRRLHFHMVRVHGVALRDKKE
jgi:hypothetical protein